MMKYLLYEKGQLKNAIECETFNEAKRLMYTKKPGKTYCIRFIENGIVREIVRLRYQQVGEFIITALI